MTRYLYQVGGLMIGFPIFIKTEKVMEIERNLMKGGTPLTCHACGLPRSSRMQPMGMRPYEDKVEAREHLKNVMEVYCVDKDDCHLVKFHEWEETEIVTKRKPGRPKKDGGGDNTI